ncbi:unnamed protein product, partial [Anisakis simplex]|uniref:LAS1-like n=1 Tax=Anisakis simplex TaxID=6269 RepID=A0A0M3J2K3_ANISI
MIVGYTTSEWLKVKSLYRSDDLAELRYAVAILQVWRIRMGNSMHVAAEMSELILSAIIADKESTALSAATSDSDWLSTFNQRLLYSAAVIRFVNYLNELCQQKQPARTMSIKQAVSMMNVPSWVVEVRHQATHQHLPSLNILRTATNWCRDWLWSNHWQKPIDEAVLYNDNDEDMHQLITIYDQIELLINDFIRDRMNSLN